MSDNNLYFNNTDGQFIISYELICLLKWLVENDSPKFKKIISKALASGLKKELTQKDRINNEYVMEDIHHTILDFFGMLESALMETINKQAAQKALEKNLIPSIDQIDSTVCDDATVRCSVEKATSKIDENAKESPRELLLKELLKHWKPNKKYTIN